MGYCIIWCDCKKGVGGLIVFVWEDIFVCWWCNLEFELVELLCFDVMDFKKVCFIVCVCYRLFKFCKIIDFLLLFILVIEFMYISC